MEANYVIEVYMHTLNQVPSATIRKRNFANARKHERLLAAKPFVEKTIIRSLITGTEWITYWPRFTEASI